MASWKEFKKPFPDKPTGQQVWPPKKKQPKYVDPEKEFLNTFHKLTPKYNSWDIFRDFVVLFATSISNSIDRLHFREREDRYLQIIRRYTPEEQKIFPQLAAHTVMALEKNPEQDFLGTIYMHLNLGSDARGQIFTPYHVSEFMAKIEMAGLYESVKDGGYVTLHDDCCGAGSTLIAGVNEARKVLSKQGLNFQNHILVTGQDIDEQVLLMCYIQLSLLGMAGYFKVGNSLTEPMVVGDSTENYWFTPIFFTDYWQMRRLCQRVVELTRGGEDFG